MALTDAVVRQAKTTGKDYTLTDADGLRSKGAKKMALSLYVAGQAAAHRAGVLSRDATESCARRTRRAACAGRPGR